MVDNSRHTSPFQNDPFVLLAEAFGALYPEKQYIAFLNPNLVDEEGNTVYGVTTFPDDGSWPIIEVSAAMLFEDAVETFAHELAHVATQENFDHGMEWGDAFARIQTEFNRIALQMVRDET